MDWEMEGILSHWNLMFLIQNYNTNLCLLKKKDAIAGKLELHIPKELITTQLTLIGL